ncbi:MAG: N-acetyltransferase family protein [Actinomycetota bacterium]
MTGDGAIRPATRADAETIAAIYRPFVESTATSFEMTPPSATDMAARIAATLGNGLPWIVADYDGAIAGYAYAAVFRSRPAYVHTRETSVYVADGWRGRGVASRLMTALIDELVELGVTQVIAGITMPNAPSVALHERLGFEPVGVFTGIGRKFDAWHDVGFWQMAVGPEA